MRRLLYTVAFLFSWAAANAQDWKTFKYETGDLLFQDLDCGEVCNALRRTTPFSGIRHYTHVGMAYVAGDSVWVIEAFDKDVHLMPLYKFMQRQMGNNGQPKVSVGRVAEDSKHLTGRAIGYALEQRGKPYDHDFALNNDKFFSSELIAEAYKAAFGGNPLFDPAPMNFFDPGSGKVHPLWKTYFDEIGMPVPLGKSSLSPADLANDDKVEIIVSFY